MPLTASGREPGRRGIEKAISKEIAFLIFGRRFLSVSDERAVVHGVGTICASKWIKGQVRWFLIHPLTRMVLPSFLHFCFEAHVAVVNIHRKLHPVRSRLLFQSLSPFHHQAMKL